MRCTPTPPKATVLALALVLGGCLSRLPRVDDALTARTPPDLPDLPPGPGLRILVLGDTGTGEEGQREVARAIAATHASHPPDFVLTVGDNFYPAGVESVDDTLWQTAFEDVYTGGFWDEMVFHPSLGNHDVAGSEEAQRGYSERSQRWAMPGRYYTFQAPLPGGDTARFLALDTNLLEEPGEGARAHAEWIDSVLAASRDRWIVAYGHHPLVTGGWHAPDQEVRDLLLPRFRGWVPLYLAGHNHSTELLRGPGGILQGVCGGGAGRDNAYRVEEIPGTLSAFSNGGWCLLYLWPDNLAVELYNRTGTLLFRHVLTHTEAREGDPG